MDTAPFRSRRFRHVVFADAIRRREREPRHAYNLAHATGVGGCSPLPSRQSLLIEPPPGGLPLPTSAAVDEDQFDSGDMEVVSALLAQAGIDMRWYRPATLRRRLAACLRILRAVSVEHARALATDNPSLLQKAVDALVIGVTRFFRDPNVFDSLNDLLRREYPGVKKNRGWDRVAIGADVIGGRRRPSFRAWSAGCSDGSELYSLAFLLDGIGLLPESDLLGTDCRIGAIARAREGVYESSSFRGQPPACVRGYVPRFFTPENGPHGCRYRVADSIRSAVRWRRGDVLNITEPGAWDLIFCRNLAIYLQPDASARLWEQLERALRPGGLLVLGTAERPFSARQLTAVAPCIYKRE